MTAKYDTTVDLENRNSSQTFAVELVGRDKDVLEVGPATGYVSRALVANGCRVVGIEVDAEAAGRAEEACERVVVGDIESMDLGEELGEERFDVITFGDVLEHLKNPLQTLQRVKPFLRPRGYVVASIPNVAHGSVRLALMQGRFPYTPLGLLDETHLRFFTRESIEQLFNDAGFLLGEMHRTRLGIFETEVEVDREAVTEEMLELVRRDPESETYQFVFAAHPSDETEAVVELSNRNRMLLDRLAENERAASKRLALQERIASEQLHQRDRLIQQLNRELRSTEDLRKALDRRNEALLQKEDELAQLKHTVVDRTIKLAQSEKTIQRLTNQLERARR